MVRVSNLQVGDGFIYDDDTFGECVCRVRQKHETETDFEVDDFDDPGEETTEDGIDYSIVPNCIQSMPNDTEVKLIPDYTDEDDDDDLILIDDDAATSDG